MRVLILALALAIGAGAGIAAPLTGKTAKKLLFSPNGQTVVLADDPALSAGQRAYVATLSKTPGFARSIGYYGALAISPGFFDRVAQDGLGAARSGLFQIAAQYHSAEAAARAALHACNRARRSRDAPCVVALRVLPKRWAPRPFSLSAQATLTFRSYQKEAAPKALAVSAATAAYAIARGPGAADAALAACNRLARKSGSPDCELAVSD